MTEKESFSVSFFRGWFRAMDKGAGRYFSSIPTFFILFFYTPVGEMFYNFLMLDIYFFQDWYRTNKYGTAYIVLFFTNEEVFNALWPYVLITLIGIFIAIWILHRSLWSLFFPSYVQVRDITQTIDGRIYYSSEGFLSRLGADLRKKYGIEDPNKGSRWFYINRNFFLNIFFPFGSMTKIILDENVKIERTLSMVCVHEPPTRKNELINNVPVIRAQKINDKLASADIDNKGISEDVSDATQELIVTAHESVNADTAIGKKLLLDGAVSLPPPLMDEIREVTEKRDRERAKKEHKNGGKEKEKIF